MSVGFSVYKFSGTIEGLNRNAVKKVIFNPDYYNPDKGIYDYYQRYSPDKSTTFMNYLFKTAYSAFRGIPASDFKYINVYNSKGKYITRYYANQQFKVTRNYGGTTVKLELVAQDKSRGNNITTKAYIDLEIPKKNLYNITMKHMFNFAKTKLLGKSLYQVDNIFENNETSGYSGEWCSWFVWNLYYKYGLADIGSWSSRDYDGDQQLSYAFGWTTIKGYNGYQRNNKFIVKRTYKPVPGDLILFKWDDSDNTIDHIGMVTGVQTFVEDKKTYYKITTLEGNFSDGYGGSVVATASYTFDNPNQVIGNISGIKDGKVMGYYSIATLFGNVYKKRL